MASFTTAMHNLTTSTSTTNSTTTSARAITINDKFDILRTVLDLATKRPFYNLEIRGTHRSTTSDAASIVTDFDFTYDITQHLVRDATYVVVPQSPADYYKYKYPSGSTSGSTSRGIGGSHQEIRLDIASLTAYIADDYSALSPPPSVAGLVDWATGPVTLLKRPMGRGRGISSTTTLDTYPTTSQITRLASRIAYGGNVTSTLRSEKPSCELLSFNSAYTPSSTQCLHVRSMWKFIVVPDAPQSPAAAEDWEMLEPDNENEKGKGKFSVPEWELDVQQAMVCKKTDWLTEDDVALLVGLPLRELVYNLNLSIRDDEEEEEKGGGKSGGSGLGGVDGKIDERVLWGCDEY